MKIHTRLRSSCGGNNSRLQRVKNSCYEYKTLNKSFNPLLHLLLCLCYPFVDLKNNIVFTGKEAGKQIFHEKEQEFLIVLLVTLY
jgi:hypothetical protein